MQGFNQIPFTNSYNTFHSQSYQPNVLSMFMNLQQTVAKQHMLLKLLLVQQQNPLLNGSQGEAQSIMTAQNFMPMEVSSQLVRSHLLKNQIGACFVKEEAGYETIYEKNVKELDHNIIVKAEVSLDTEASSEDGFSRNTPNSDFLSASLEESGSDEEDDKESENKIIRKNGFKLHRELDEQSETSKAKQRKSNKVIVPKRPPSKAKHLWINYGRKIVEFAVNHTTEDVQNKVKQLIGKLSSKKDFEDVFGEKAR